MSFWSTGLWIFLGDDFLKCSRIQHFLVRQWIQLCVNLRCLRIPRNAWIDSGYTFASIYGALRISAQCLDRQWIQFSFVYGFFFSYFSAMLGLTVDTYCRARRRVGSGMAIAGLLVTMISRCVHFVVGRPVESSQVHSLRQFQLLVLPAGMRSRLFGALCIGTGPGGYVHRDMTPIIRCIRAVVWTKTLLLHLVRTTTTTTTTRARSWTDTRVFMPCPHNNHHSHHTGSHRFVNTLLSVAISWLSPAVDLVWVMEMVPRSGEGSDDCARGADTSSRRWLRCWRRCPTTRTQRWTPRTTAYGH